MKVKAIFFSLICSMFLGCGGGGDETSTAVVVPDENANGIWSGITTTPGFGSADTVALFNDGDFVAINLAFGEFYKGTYTIDGDDISANLLGFELNGPFGGTGTLTGTVTSKGTLMATVDASTGTASDVDLVYETQAYERTITLADLAGSWSGSAPGLSFSITVDTSGAFVAIGSDGCIASGDLSIPVSNRNMIAGEISVSGAGCSVSGNYDGLGALADNLATNDVLIFGYANNDFGFAYAASRD